MMGTYNIVETMKMAGMSAEQIERALSPCNADRDSKIAELEKHVERLENAIKGLVLMNEYRRRSDGFFPTDVEIKYIGLIRKIEEDFQIQRRAEMELKNNVEKQEQAVDKDYETVSAVTEAIRNNDDVSN